jgi:uncharacterized protein YutE (UPF0331/DUF86 family)
VDEPNGVLAQKLALLDSYCRRLQQLAPASLEALRGNWERQKALERILQVMIEIVIDVADRIISLRGLPPASTSAASLTALQEIGAIEDAGRYQPMVRFRIFIVRRYEDVDLEILFAVATRHLPDFTRYEQEIRRFLQIGD